MLVRLPSCVLLQMRLHLTKRCHCTGPQFDALLDLLTVREHLELFSRIKNVPETELNASVDAALNRMDLMRYANKLAGALSGGNKRKLCVVSSDGSLSFAYRPRVLSFSFRHERNCVGACCPLTRGWNVTLLPCPVYALSCMHYGVQAMAIMGKPRVVFLDEPSTGVDPVARRFMWDIISEICADEGGTTVILTTHNMEECEALCTRLGIMVGGYMRCLGSITHLRDRFGQGYQLELKLRYVRVCLARVYATAPMRALSLSLRLLRCVSFRAGLELTKATCVRCGAVRACAGTQQRR
jgi:energy-coupling factor transporter ATP-binding protein EcfA2